MAIAGDVGSTLPCRPTTARGRAHAGRGDVLGVGEPSRALVFVGHDDVFDRAVAAGAGETDRRGVVLALAGTARSISLGADAGGVSIGRCRVGTYPTLTRRLPAMHYVPRDT